MNDSQRKKLGAMGILKKGETKEIAPTWYDNKSSSTAPTSHSYSTKGSRYIDEFPDGFRPVMGSGEINMQNAVVISPKQDLLKSKEDRIKFGKAIEKTLNIHVLHDTHGNGNLNSHGGVTQMVTNEDLKNLTFGNRRLKDYATVTNGKEKYLLNAGDTIFTTRGTIGRTRFFDHDTEFVEE